MSSASEVDLALVIAFVNTLDVERDTDGLATARELGAWLTGAGLLGPGRRVTETDRGRALELREALRHLMAANNGGPAVPEAAQTLQDVADRGGLTIAFGPDGSLGFQTISNGVAGALATLLIPVAEAMQDGRWTRVKACRESGCEWAFYDHSRNRAGVWCDMAVCGNRTKVRSYRARTRGSHG